MRRVVELKIAMAIALAATAGVALAEDASPAPKPAENPVIAPQTSDKPADSPARPHHSRAISPEVAAQLSAAAPKFEPPKPKPAVTSEEDLPDEREVDKPKNGIVRLPKYVVTEKPPPVLSERAVYTKSGLADLASKRYLKEGYRALNAFTLPLFGNSPGEVAMMMYEEDERLRNMAALNEDARMVSSSDKAAGLYLKREIDQTYMRAPDFDWKPIGR